MSFLTLVSPLVYNCMQQSGVDPTGVADSTTGLQNGINDCSTKGGGNFGFPPGTFLISSPLSFPTNVRPLGSGLNVSIIKMSSGFSGAAAFLINSDTYVSVRDLTILGFSTTYSSNPAANGINIIGTTDVRLENVELDYINGFCVESDSTGSVGNTHIVLDNVTGHLSAQGVHTLGVSGSGGVGLHRFINCNMSGIQGGDCYLHEDDHDILLLNCTGEVTAGTGASIHAKGNCGAITCTNCDFGPNPGPSLGAVIQISSDVNGSPKNILILGGIIEGGGVGVQINAGSFVKIGGGCRIFNNNTAAINIGVNATLVDIGECVFDQNGSVAGSGRYDIVNNATAGIFLHNNSFLTPQGSGANQVNSCINDIGNGIFYNANFHDPNAGWNVTNIFASGNAPTVYQNIMGPAAQGIISTTTPGGSPYILNGVAYPRFIYVNGGTVTEIDIGGTNSQRVNGGFYVPPHTSFKVIYSAAPVVVVSTIST